MKIPAPTMPPITIMVASKSPTWRSSWAEACAGGAEVAVGSGVIRRVGCANVTRTVSAAAVAAILRKSGRSAAQAIEHCFPLGLRRRSFDRDPVVAARVERVQDAVEAAA